MRGTELAFNPDKGFMLAPDPRDSRKNDALGEMFRLLLESGGTNKTDFLKCCGDAGIGSRQVLSTLFEAGTGKYWTVEKGAHNAHNVKPIQLSSWPDSYSSEKLENCEGAGGSNNSSEASGSEVPTSVLEPKAENHEVGAEKQPDSEVKAPSAEPVDESTRKEETEVQALTSEPDTTESTGNGSEEKPPADANPDDEDNEDVDFSEVRRLVAEVSEETVTEEDDE